MAPLSVVANRAKGAAAGGAKNNVGVIQVGPRMHQDWA